MDHRVNRLEIAKCLAALVAMTVSLPKQLRPYQMETIVSMIRWLEDSGGSRRAYVAHATGMGKTTLFASMITACAGLRILVVVPSKVLVEQTVRELYTFTGGLIGHVSSLNKIKDDDGEVIAMKGHDLFDVVVVTDASLARHGRKLAKEFNPHLVIRDECHWTYAEKRQKVMDFYSESVTVGFSATPDYLTTQARSTFVPVTLDNGQVLYAPEDRIARAHYSTCLDERAVRWGIEEGYLAPLAWGHVEFDISLDDLRTADGDCGPDFREEDLHALLEKKWQFMQDTIVELYKSGEYGLRDRQVFAVCHGVEAADRLAVALRGIGVSSACITGKTRDIERNAILSAFQSGAIKFLSSVMVLREGWNAPNAEVCLMLRPTKSRVFYVQSMGRVLRPSEDGSAKVALVIDALYQNTAFAPLSAPVLFGYPGQEVSSGDILINAHGDASRVQESPYKTGLVRPKLVTVEALKIEYWADAEGKMIVDGAEWRNLTSVCALIGVAPSSFISRVEKRGCRTMQGHSGGRQVTFYSVEGARQLFADLLDLPECDEEGFIEEDGVRWGTLAAIAVAIGVSVPAISDRLEKMGASVRYGRNRNRRRFSFYPLEAVEMAFAGQGDLPQADDSGFFEADGVRWGMARDIAKELGLSTAFERRRDRHLRKREGRGRHGGVATFYAVDDVMREFAELLSDLPVTGPDGILVADGEEWMTLGGFAARHGTMRDVIEARLVSAACRNMRGKDVGGRVFTYYAVADLNALAADLSAELPQADDTGFFKTDGVLWGTVSGLKDHFKAAHTTIYVRTKAEGVRSRKGRTILGRTRMFYALPDVERALNETPKRVVAKKGEGKRRRKLAH